MIDLYLKTDSELDMIAALTDVGFTKDPQSKVLFHQDAALFVIGTIYKPTGVSSVIDGENVQVLGPIPGWHANVRTNSESLASALAPMDCKPASPTCVFA